MSGQNIMADHGFSLNCSVAKLRQSCNESPLRWRARRERVVISAISPPLTNCAFRTRSRAVAAMSFDSGRRAAATSSRSSHASCSNRGVRVRSGSATLPLPLANRARSGQSRALHRIQRLDSRSTTTGSLRTSPRSSPPSSIGVGFPTGRGSEPPDRPRLSERWPNAATGLPRYETPSRIPRISSVNAELAGEKHGHHTLLDLVQLLEQSFVCSNTVIGGPEHL